MPLPFVTIVMATLDAAEHLPESLASIAAQTYDHHELVVVDGGSTDGTCEILAGFPRARVIRQQSRGFANAWNEGIAAARGDCIAFLDSDDRWRPQALAAHAERSVLLINPLIYAEVSVGFDRIEDVEAALPLDLYRREPVPFEAAFLAGKAFLAYRRRGGDKRSPLPDFFIGGHAAVGGYVLLTRDTARYRTYFPKLVVVEP